MATDIMEKGKNQSRKRPKSIVLIGLLAAGIGIFLLLQWKRPSNNRSRPPQVAATRPAPDFVLPLLDGKIVRLSDYRGKVVFLNIWATWCAPCRDEMPAMEKLYQELKDHKFEILAVSIDSQGAEAVKPFVKENNLSFPVLLDVDAKVSRLYNTTGIPETFIIDKNGTIVSKIIGPRNWADPEAVGFFRDLARKPVGGK